jgi:hypothetical protein
MEMAHGAATRRPPVSLDMMVPRTGGDTHDASVWDSSIVQGAYPVAPCPKPGGRHDSHPSPSPPRKPRAARAASADPGVPPSDSGGSGTSMGVGLSG